jgi:hypothetical protein
MMERIYHPFQEWEDFREGMYKTTCFMDAESMVRECAATLACPQWLNECMMFVVVNWERAAEQNLTNLSRNRQAWLGQAACCCMHGAPEYITKLAWNTLTETQQAAANAVADECIAWWDARHMRQRMPRA